MSTSALAGRPLRILLATRGSAGHVLPLAPFGQACARAGHEVTVAAQRQHRANVERTGLAFAPFDDPPEEEWMPLIRHFGEQDVAAAHALMVAEFFGRVDLAAALPGLRDLVGRTEPDVIVRDSWEFASTLVAESHGVPLVRVGLGLAAVEEQSIALAAAAVDRARAVVGLPADPAGDRMRDTPYLTMMPGPIEDPAVAVPRLTHRFRTRLPEAATPLPEWWPGNDDPLVYLTFGSVTALPHLPYFPALYRAAIDALAPLPVRVLVTVGAARDPAALGPARPNVRVERWVDQDVVAARADAIVCHGGYGSTLGALAHGVPLVVLPLFSGDQWANAEAVARTGAGVALDADRATRRVLGLPDSATLGGLADAVRRVLNDDAYRRRARGVCTAVRALPPVEAAVDVLTAIADRGAPGR